MLVCVLARARPPSCTVATSRERPRKEKESAAQQSAREDNLSVRDFSLCSGKWCARGCGSGRCGERELPTAQMVSFLNPSSSTTRMRRRRTMSENEEEQEAIGGELPPPPLYWWR